MKNKELYTVSEFAKLRNMTAETLRHYDRIGLLKPAYIDPDTNYRYYSIFQYEKLGTIKELRQLGMPLEVIKDYFTDRNLKKSISILQDSYEEVLKQKRELEELEQVIRGKLDFLCSVTKMNEFNVPKVVHIETRYLVTSGTEVRDEDEMGYEWTMLEKNLKELSPILATSRIGYLYDFMEGADVEELKKIPFVFQSGIRNQEKADKLLSELPSGQYADIYVRGYGNHQKAYELLMEYIRERGLKPVGKVVTFFPVDITVTDNFDEEILELQIRVEEGK